MNVHSKCFVRHCLNLGKNNISFVLAFRSWKRLPLRFELVSYRYLKGWKQISSKHCWNLTLLDRVFVVWFAKSLGKCHNSNGDEEQRTVSNKYYVFLQGKIWCWNKHREACVVCVKIHSPPKKKINIARFLNLETLNLIPRLLTTFGMTEF